MNQSAFKEICSIAIRLTVTCLIAGVIMGTTFLLTHDAKEHNEQLRDERVMYELLGYGKGNPAPQTMSMHTMYRYVLAQGESQSVAYVLPTVDGKYVMVELDLEGRFVKQYPLEGDAAKMRKETDRTGAVAAAVGAGVEPRYADTMVIVADNGKRSAYILDGKYPGFKTHIRVKIALKHDYSMLGFEVLEHEEDPGLGAEIVQPWFRGQFENRSFDDLKTLEVVKKPMPDDYMNALAGKLPPEEAQSVRTAHAEDPIYALTGATISSRAVLNGNKAIVRKFAYRMDLLDKALKSQNIQTGF